MTVNLESFRVDPKDFREYWNSYNVIRDSDGTLCECRLNYPSLNYDEEKANFLMKVEMLANCQHPAITPLIGFSEGDKDGYLYMLIKEDSLKTIGRFSRYPPEYNDTAKQIILYGIACSLEYLHNKGFSKCFIALSDILLDRDLHPFLSNFGFSRRDNLELEEYSAISLPSDSFSAPEILNCCNLYTFTEATDVFAYSGVVFAVLTDKMPFEKMNFYIKSRAIKSGDRPYIPEFVPEHWRNLLNQCWAQDPNKRLTFTEICDMLETDDFVNNLSDRGAFDEYKKQMEPFRPSSKKSDKSIESHRSKDNIFIGEDNQKYYKKIDDIGEGRRSIAYKIIDTRTNEILCKKVVKIQDDSTSFKNIKNAIKEFEVLHSIKHPCICSAFAINPAEPFSNVTTVSLYLEFIPRKLKVVITINL